MTHSWQVPSLHPASVAAASVAIVLAGFGGCSSSPSGPARVQSAQPPLRTDSNNVLVCGTLADAHGVQRPSEYYIRSAIALKLRTYPELAKALGMTSVSTCDEARQYARTYHAYSQAHPNFDAREPLGDDTAPLPKLEPKVVQYLTPKIRNGIVTSQSPVVRLCGGSTQPCNASMGGDVCTGTFISKHWIATAAHCMEFVLKTASTTGDVLWTIDWADANGNSIPVSNLQPPPSNVEAELVAMVSQYPDTRWTGQSPMLSNEEMAHNDFALLFLGTGYDYLLPPDPNTGAAMRFSTVNPVLSELRVDYGWGLPNHTQQGMFIPALDAVNALTFQAPSPSSDPTVCEGDSGGPVVRTVTIGGTETPVIEGTLSRADTKDSATCAIPPGEIYWTRIDQELDWIHKNMGAWQEDLCANNGDIDSFQCWGASCSSDSDCMSGYACSEPGSAVQGPCPVCGGTSASCDCVKGQCVQSEFPDASDLPPGDGGDDGSE